MPERSAQVRVGTTDLFVREWGPLYDPDAVPLVFWHALGSATSGEYLAEVAPLLVAEHGLRVVAPDAPGFGRSPAVDRRGYDPERSADLLAALIEELGLSRPVLAGHSWGGVVASLLAARLGDGVRGLVLVDSGHLDYPDAAGFDPALTFEERVVALSSPDRRLPAVPWQTFVDNVRAELPRWSPATASILRAGVELASGRVREIPTPAVKAAIQDALGHRRVSDAWDAIAAAGIPVLLMTSTRPVEAASLNAEAAARYVARVPQTTWEPIDGARHDLLLDAGPRVADAIGRWLAEAGPRPSITTGVVGVAQAQPCGPGG
jgi:pimeloyl-ACP methyl ester carboxylesterase